MEPVAAALARLSKAQAKCAKELKELSDSHAASPAWASAGIAALVRLCHDPAAGGAAAATLANLSQADDSNDDRIREAGAIPPLVALLSGGPESEAAEEAALALSNLASDDEGEAAVTEAGAIPPLVALLSGGPESEAAQRAAGALRNLTSSDANKAAIIRAGAIPLLMALLSGGRESKTASEAAIVLANLATTKRRRRSEHRHHRGGCRPAACGAVEWWARVAGSGQCGWGVAQPGAWH